MGKQPLNGTDLDKLISAALDEARLHADDPGPLSQNWSQIALAAATLRLSQVHERKAE